MSTLASILSIARTAISTQQSAMQVVSQNIANASTPGYSRQRAELVASIPQRTPTGTIGTGVTVVGTTRARDILLDQGFRQEASNAAASNARHDTLSVIEGVFNEPSDSGLSASLDAFWSSWSDLANDPASPTAQGVVRQRGDAVARTLQSFSAQLDQVREQTVHRLTASVDTLNQLARQVAAVNKDIVSAEAGGGQAPDLRDARDRLLDQMAAIAPISVVVGDSGRLAVTLAGETIVDAAESRDVAVTGTGLAPTISVSGDPTPIGNVGGMIGMLATLVGTDIASIRTSLDGLARALVNGVNEIHSSGYTAAGSALGGSNWNPVLGPTGSRVAFFDPAGVTAGTISLSTAVKTNSAVIAAGAVNGATGDNSVATQIGALRDRTGMAALQTRMGAVAFTAQVGLPGGTSLGEHYGGIVANLGLQVSSAAGDVNVGEVLRDQAETRRSAVSGVSIDDELTQLMSHQQAYAAAAKLVKAADDMAMAILGMVN